MRTRHSTCLFLTSVSACLKNYSNRPITFSCGNKGLPHLLITSSLPHHHSWSCFVHLFPRATPTWPCMAVMSSSSELWVDVTNCCQSHLPSVRCCVFSHPHNPRAGISPFINKVKKRQIKHAYPLSYVLEESFLSISLNSNHLLGLSITNEMSCPF